MITSRTVLTIIKLVLAAIALFLAAMNFKNNKRLVVYWVIVCIYWLLNALT